MNSRETKVLIVDDNEDVLLAAKLLLKPHCSIISLEKNPNNLYEVLKNETYDVIFLDMNYTKDITSGHEGFFWLKEILKIDPTTVVILITAFGDVEKAVKAIKEGATDFILKPWQNEKFLATFFSALKLRESRLELENLRMQHNQLNKDIDKNFFDMIGAAPSMQKVFNTISKVAETDANVLILGENGTGKELAARALHRQSLKKDKAFISVDMGSLSHSLFESELFGHVKGAFTNAVDEKPGRFEIASRGTLFLDEIGNIPIELQAKLLAVLQNRQVTRVGSNKPKQIDIRLICATNMPIYQMVEEKKFRQDLLYRINTVEIHLPPLRERREDIQLLAEHYLTLFRKKYNKQQLAFHETTLRMFENYPWFGNVRELQHSIERAAIMCETDILLPSDFFLQNSSKNNFTINTSNLDEVEKQTIKKVLSKNNGNISQAAKELGLTRTSLYRRMEKYGM